MPGVMTGKKVVDEKGKPICGARTKGGKSCRSQPMANGRCRFHGGNNAKGEQSGTFKEGRYSKYVPKNLKQSYERAINDEDLLSLRDDVALLEARQVELLERVGKIEQPPWVLVVKAVARMKQALSLGKGAEAAFNALEKVVTEGAGKARQAESTWNRIQTIIKDKRDTAKAEWDRLNQLSGVVTVEQAMLFVRALLTAARDTVKDKDQLRELNLRVLKLLPNGQTNEVPSSNEPIPVVKVVENAAASEPTLVGEEGPAVASLPYGLQEIASPDLGKAFMDTGIEVEAHPLPPTDDKPANGEENGDGEWSWRDENDRG